jgi:Large polyvalent protein associated domain 29
MATTYETCAATAKRLRAALKAHFPGVTFSVRSSTYSGGASIRVKWTDGPRRPVVEAVAHRFAGATFDGMIDLKTHHTTVVVDETGPKVVQYGADFVFCERTITDEAATIAAAQAMIEARCHIELGRFGTQWVPDLARGMAWDRDADGSLDGAFRRIVLRETAPVTPAAVDNG